MNISVIGRDDSCLEGFLVLLHSLLLLPETVVDLANVEGVCAVETRLNIIKCTSVAKMTIP